MADEQNTEQVEQTTTENVENVETKQEQSKETYVNNKGSQIDIDKVVGDQNGRQKALGEFKHLLDDFHSSRFALFFRF